MEKINLVTDATVASAAALNSNQQRAPTNKDHIEEIDDLIKEYSKFVRGDDCTKRQKIFDLKKNNRQIDFNSLFFSNNWRTIENDANITHRDEIYWKYLSKEQRRERVKRECYLFYRHDTETKKIILENKIQILNLAVERSLLMLRDN